MASSGMIRGPIRELSVVIRRITYRSVAAYRSVHGKVLNMFKYFSSPITDKKRSGPLVLP